MSSRTNPWTAEDQWRAERAWLCRWGWSLSLLIAAFGLWWATSGWSFLTLDSSLRVPVSLALQKKSFWAASAAGILVPVVWALGLSLSRRLLAGRRAFTPVAILAVLALAGLDGLVRQRPVQDALWAAVRSRAGGDSFMRELANLRLDCCAQRDTPPAGRGVVLAGSSQIIYGIDAQELEQRIHRPVYRRALAGMFALEACLAQDYLVAPGSDTAVLLISGFDMRARSFVECNWMRPLASWHGWRDLYRSLDPSLRRTFWRQLVDLGAASSSELWRLRDYLRHALWNSRGVVVAAPGVLEDSPDLQRQRKDYSAQERNARFVEASFRAYECVLRRLGAEGYTLLILEGNLNPAARSEASSDLDRRTRVWIEQMASTLPIRFIPREQQVPAVRDDEWLDMLHVRAEGRRKITETVATALTNLEANRP